MSAASPCIFVRGKRFWNTLPCYSPTAVVRHFSRPMRVCSPPLPIQTTQSKSREIVDEGTRLRHLRQGSTDFLDSRSCSIRGKRRSKRTLTGLGAATSILSIAHGSANGSSVIRSRFFRSHYFLGLLPCGMTRTRVVTRRPIVVSAYFHMRRARPELLHNTSVDKFALKFLPAACKWVSIRYLLFGEILGHKSSLFWYDDALDNPREWHNDFYELVGLRMPMSVLAESVAVATGQVFDSRVAGFPIKGIDVHSGGRASRTAGERTFRDEVSEATASKMDVMLQVWLPPAILHKFGML